MTESSPEESATLPEDEPGDTSGHPYRLSDAEIQDRYEKHTEWLQEEDEPLEDLKAALDGVDLEGRDLADENWSYASFVDSNLREAKLQNGTFAETDFSGADLTDADFTGADCTDTDFSNATLVGAVFRGAVLNGATFTEADLRVSEFAGAEIENAEYKQARATGAAFTNVEGRRARFESAVLKRSDFHEARLRNAVFTGADVSYARFEGATLTDANFRDAVNIETVRISGTELKDALLPDDAPSGLSNPDPESTTPEDRTSDADASLSSRNYSADPSFTMTREELQAHLKANEARVEQMTESVTSKVDALSTRIDDRFDDVDRRIDDIKKDSRFTRNSVLTVAGVMAALVALVVTLLIYGYGRVETIEDRLYDAARSGSQPTAPVPGRASPSEGATQTTEPSNQGPPQTQQQPPQQQPRQQQPPQGQPPQ